MCSLSFDGRTDAGEYLGRTVIARARHSVPVPYQEWRIECEGHDEERQTFDGQDQIIFGIVPCLSQFIKENVTLG